MLTFKYNVDALGNHSITSHSLEAAVSALCQKVFGAPLVIEPAPAPAPTPVTYETESDPDILRAQRDGWEETAAQHCGNTEYYRGLVTAIGKALGTAAYQCDDGSTATDVLCAKVPELVAAVIADKEAMIQRLKVKLEALEGETKRLHTKWHAAEELSTELKDGWDRQQKDLLAYSKFTTNIAKSLGMSTREINLVEVVEEVERLSRWKKESMEVAAAWDKVDAYVREHKDTLLGSYVSEVALERIKERDTFKAETKRLTHLLDHAQEGNRKRDGQAQMAKVLHDIQVAALVGHRDGLQKERDTFKALAEALSQKATPQKATPQYRDLEEGELIHTTDEWRHEEGKWHVRDTVAVGERLHLTENGGTHTPHRRKL